MIVKKFCESCSTEEITDVTCDICKNSCMIENKKSAKPDKPEFEYATLTAGWGPGSNSYGKIYKSEICERCFFMLRNEHKIDSAVSLLSSEFIGGITGT